MRLLRRLVRRVLATLHLLAPARRLLGRPAKPSARPAAPPVVMRGHGHALLIELLSRLRPDGRTGYLVEIGTTREKIEGQGSTVQLAELAKGLGLPFVTVDMDPRNTEQARRDLEGVGHGEAVTAKGEDFLRSFGEPVVAAYLDAFDIQHGQHSADRVERYRTYLGTEITNEGAERMHRACAEALMPLLADGGLIVIDDTWSDGDGYHGKGATAVPLLLEQGFGIVGRTKTAVGLRRG